jgi:hypothetical protein
MKARSEEWGGGATQERAAVSFMERVSDRGFGHLYVFLAILYQRHEALRDMIRHALDRTSMFFHLQQILCDIYNYFGTGRPRLSAMRSASRREISSSTSPRMSRNALCPSSLQRAPSPTR